VKKLYELLNDTSKTIPTYHEKLMTAEEIQDEYESLHTDIEYWNCQLYENEIVKMKKIVPEFKSMNSPLRY
jgi:hypothetical protein